MDRENADKRGGVNVSSPPPVDYYGKIYLAMILAGTGFLFPYNR